MSKATLLATVRREGFSEIASELASTEYNDFLTTENAATLTRFLNARSDVNGRTNLQMIGSLDPNLQAQVVSAVLGVANGESVDFSSFSASDVDAIAELVEDLDFRELKDMLVSSAPDQLHSLVDAYPDISFGILNGTMIRGIATSIAPVAEYAPDTALSIAMTTLGSEVRASGSYEAGDNLDSFVNFGFKAAADQIER